MYRILETESPSCKSRGLIYIKKTVRPLGYYICTSNLKLKRSTNPRIFSLYTLTVHRRLCSMCSFCYFVVSGCLSSFPNGFRMIALYDCRLESSARSWSVPVCRRKGCGPKSNRHTRRTKTVKILSSPQRLPRNSVERTKMLYTDERGGRNRVF
jgi:hypothetical protein